MPDDRGKKLENFFGRFGAPPAEFRPAPFWFLNHRLKKEEITWQIGEMQKQGIGGIVLHARHGLLTPYLSEEWFRIIRRCCESAEAAGLWIWIYDEYNWPSGTADGKVIMTHPHYRLSYLYQKNEGIFRGGRELAISFAHPEQVLYAFALRRDAAETRVVNLSGGRSGNKLPPGNWEVISLRRGNHDGGFNRGYLDVLNADAVREFIRLTHREYRKKLGMFFGKTIKGFFTDEPSMHYQQSVPSLPWTSKLPELFRAMKSYPLTDALPHLFNNLNARSPLYRFDYMDVITTLFVKNYFERIGNFCRNNRLSSIGHLDSEGELIRHAKRIGNLFTATRSMDYAGVDALFDTTWPRDGYCNNLIGPKLASSAGHLLGKPRVMSEAFGVAGGWRLNLRTLKYLADWQTAMGINYFIPHAFYYSIEGFRKWECPPDEFYRNPWWRHYHLFTDHISRLSAALSGGRHVAPAAVLSPVESLWFEPLATIDSYYRFRNVPPGTDHARRCEVTVNTVCERLMREQYDFDFLDISILEKAGLSREGEITVRDGRGRIRESYSLLVVPAVRLLPEGTIAKLNSLTAAGATVLWIDIIPRCLAGRREIEAQGGFLARGTTKMMQFIRRRISPVIRITPRNRDIIAYHYQNFGVDYYFLFNTSHKRRYDNIRIRFNITGHLYLCDTSTGKTVPILTIDGSGKREPISIRCSFAPAQSFLLMITEEKIERVKRVAPTGMVGNRPPVKSVTLGKTWRFRISDRLNVLPLKKWESIMAGGTDSMGWHSSRHIYRTTFHIERRPPGKLFLLLDGLMQRDRVFGKIPPPPVVSDIPLLLVNGKKVKTIILPGIQLDRLVPAADITAFVRRGINRLEIIGEGFFGEAPTLKETLYIAGNFSLAGRGGKESLTLPRTVCRSGLSWTEQGYPFFSGTASYEQEFNLPTWKRGMKAVIHVGNAADCVDVVINNHVAGILCWEPWEIAVGNQLRKGRNTIRLNVANGLSNLLLCTPRPSGLLGEVRIDFFHF